MPSFEKERANDKEGCMAVLGVRTLLLGEDTRRGSIGDASAREHVGAGGRVLEAC